jgi:NAD+ kinase
MVRSVAIYSKTNNPRTAESVRKLTSEFCRRGVRTCLYQKSIDKLTRNKGELTERFSDLTTLGTLPDLVLSVGGDGTFLETMLKVRDFGIPIAGVNAGRMGFLANISEEEIGHSIDLLCDGRYKVVERSLIEIKHPDNLFEVGMSTALNEVTVQKADPSMITINVDVDGTYLNTYWADGLIISTATGSTAYNLSVGGPILSPEDESIIISPISPHNLTIRPIILSGDNVLKMSIECRSNDYIATCDFRSRRVEYTEDLIIARSKDKLKSVMLEGMDFYSTLRNKLMWGADRRN